MKFLTRQGFNSLTGLDVVRVSGQHTLRTHLSVILEEYRIDRVIDVGANEGGFGNLLRSIGFRGEIYSFEPVSSAYQVLHETSSRDPRWHAYKLALGSCNKTATIHVSKFTQMSSFLEASTYGAQTWPNLKIDSDEDVEIRTLSECYRQGLVPDGGRVLLKMDTQGFDLEVFKGAMPMRKNIVCLLSELSLLKVYDGMPDFVESISMFRDSGFVVTGMFPITRNNLLSVNEVDCVLADPTQHPRNSGSQ